MKTPKDLIIIIFVVMFSVSCAGVSKIPFKTMVEEADSRVGESVTLGGYILNSQIVSDKTDITILQTPLDLKTKPQDKDKSEGRFFVSYGGKFNFNDYSPKDRITVTGKIAGIAKEKVEHCPSPCLKIESNKLRMWREYEYYPPPSRGP
jgi:starvation-inducible outer membrane lipoprotein